MKKRSWNDIEGALKTQAAAPMRGKDEFWEDFRARARLRVQQQPAREPSRVIYRWPLATACATLLIAVWAGIFFYMPSTGSACTIESLEITARHSAVLIMNDEPSKSTILWVVDMEHDGSNGGGT